MRTEMCDESGLQKLPDGMSYSRSTGYVDRIPYVCRHCHQEFLNKDKCPYCCEEREQIGQATLTDGNLINIGHTSIEITNCYGRPISRIDGFHIASFQCDSGTIVLDMLDGGWPILLRMADPEDAQRIYWYLRQMAFRVCQGRGLWRTGRGGVRPIHIQESTGIGAFIGFAAGAAALALVYILANWSIPFFSGTSRALAVIAFIGIGIASFIYSTSWISRQIDRAVLKHQLEKIALRTRQGLDGYTAGPETPRGRRRWFRPRTNSGRRSNGYPDDWDDRRRAVYRRDGYRCVNCGATDVELHAHHIVPLSVGGSNNTSNIVTLCRACHESLHPHMRA
ncbi:MAG: HNH endonuclease [Thermomicrobiales bacterium]|nr:HNH endonuclease [Thermomicrobiales bacterium]